MDKILAEIMGPAMHTIHTMDIGNADTDAKGSAEWAPPAIDIDRMPLSAKLLAAKIKDQGWTFVDCNEDSRSWRMRFRHPSSRSSYVDVRYTISPDPDGFHFSVGFSSRATADSSEELQKAIDIFTTLQI